MRLSSTRNLVLFLCFTFLFLFFPPRQSLLFADTFVTNSQIRAIILTGRGIHEVQVPSEPLEPTHHIRARIHIGDSFMTEADLQKTLTEINTIWWTQAGICFDFEVANHDETLENGFDLWFGGDLEGWDGFFVDTDEMRVADSPKLQPASFSSDNNAARTAAHEFGHALQLLHRQDSDSNLMRCQTVTFRWFSLFSGHHLNS